MNKIIEAASQGAPLYIIPHKEPKVWGVSGIGEYWYGAEEGAKSSTARVGSETAPMDEVLKSIPGQLLGKSVVEKYGQKLPLVKILTPKGRLSVQFHDSKNELWVVTGIDTSLAAGRPAIILGFSEDAVKKHGRDVCVRYREALEDYGEKLNDLIDLAESAGYKDLLNEKKNVISAAKEIRDPLISKKLSELYSSKKALENFYHYKQVSTGDVIPVPSGTLHALGPGIEVVEPQIPGPTQSMEDGETYPVRYYFPGHKRGGAKKELDISRTGEIDPKVAVGSSPEIVRKTGSVAIERLPGGFEDKGMAVHRIIFARPGELDVAAVQSFHSVVAVKGKAVIRIKEKDYDVPSASSGGEMMIIPASAGGYKIISAKPDTRLIDTFTPINQ